MDNIIDKENFSNKKIIIYSCILSIVMFLIMGNLGLVAILCVGSSTISRIYMLEKGFSMTFLDICILYIVLGCLVCLVLKEKRNILKDYVKIEEKDTSILIKNIKGINKIMLIAVTLNLIIKILIYIVFKGVLKVNFNIGINELFLSLLYMTLIIFITYSLIMIGYVSVRDFISSAFDYSFIFCALYLILGTGSLFISEKISIIQNIIGSIYNIYNSIVRPFYAFSSIYSLEIMDNIKIIFALTTMFLIMIYIFKNFTNNLNKKNIKEYYINTCFRKLFYMSIAIILGYCVFVVGFVLLISFSMISYDWGLLIINLVQVAVSILIYFKLDKIYLKRKNLNKEKRKKKEKTIKENQINLSENSVKEKNVLISEETLVFNKSIDAKDDLRDCEKIRDFSFEEDLILEVDDDLIDSKNISNSNDLADNEEIKDEIIGCKDIDDEKLIDFLKDDNLV